MDWSGSYIALNGLPSPTAQYFSVWSLQSDTKYLCGPRCRSFMVALCFAQAHISKCPRLPPLMFRLRSSWSYTGADRDCRGLLCYANMQVSWANICWSEERAAASLHSRGGSWDGPQWWQRRQLWPYTGATADHRGRYSLHMFLSFRVKPGIPRSKAVKRQWCYFSRSLGAERLFPCRSAQKRQKKELVRRCILWSK